MSVLLVTYDLNKETKRPPLLKDLKDAYPAWAMLSESSYAISTASTPQQVYDRLKKHIDDNDRLAIITLKKPYQGWLGKDVHEWLEQHLPH